MKFWLKWIPKLANIGFALASLYLVYLLGSLLWSAKVNDDLEGAPFGRYTLATMTAGSSPVTSFVPLEFGSDGRKRALVLWATWCGPCHALLDDLREAVQAGELKAESVLAISVAEPANDVVSFITKFPMPFPVAIDPDAVVGKRLRLSGTPTIALIDSNGVLQTVATGGFRLRTKIVDFLAHPEP